MRTVLLGVFITMFAQAYGQSLSLIWETDTLLAKPEYAIYDYKNQIIYVSNINGEYCTKDGNGFISKVGLDGKIIELKWIDGLNSPQGLALYNKHLAEDTDKKPDIPSENPLFSAGLHTLSIHVKDSIVHDSVFHFLVDKLKLPIYYYPVGQNTKYAGVYAGNMVLEPCGPYINRFSYANDNFRAIFFGLTFEPFETITQSVTNLTDRNIDCQTGDNFIYLQKDTALCGDNITISFIDRGHEKISDARIKDSLRNAMNAGSETIYKVFRVYEETPASYASINYNNELGIEYVKEICIGYDDSLNLQKWKQLISPEEFSNSKTWKASGLLEFKFVKSTIKEVQSITFKVKSLENARQYLVRNSLFGKYSGNTIEIDKKQAFGLSIYLTEDD